MKATVNLEPAKLRSVTLELDAQEFHDILVCLETAQDEHIVESKRRVPGYDWGMTFARQRLHAELENVALIHRI